MGRARVQLTREHQRRRWWWRCHEADDAGNTAFRAIEIGEGGHGNRLIVPEADPSALRVLLDFLAELFPA